METTITGTDFKFPDQTAHYRGKVRDLYTIRDKYLVAVSSDRISAFDVILPRPIPCKGQVLNQLAANLLATTKDIAPNWLISTPDPSVSIGYKCQPFKIEMIVRANLVGHAWRIYNSGGREICGQQMPAGMEEYDPFPEPIVTPTTKVDGGHDEDLTPKQLVDMNLASKHEFERLSELSLALFKRGQETAKKRGLRLSDTKYEFGMLNENIYIIDEIHTPDSSRYFYLDSYEVYIKNKSKPKPKHLSKEFVREWLMERGFSGQPGESLPEMTDEFIKEVSDRYIELYEKTTGKKFKRPSTSEDPYKRIEEDVLSALARLK